MKPLRLTAFIVIAILISSAVGCSSLSEAERAYNKGTDIFRQGLFEGAVPHYTTAIQLDPNYADAYSSRGGLYSILGQYEDALQDFEKAIQLDPDSGPYIYRGITYSELGEYQKAINDYTRLIQIDPYDAYALHMRSLAYYSLGQTANAKDDRDDACYLSLKYC